jgi:RHS repeat-associated protein
MAVTTYTNFLGRVVREDRGGTVRDYGRDALGSTAALYDTSGNKTDEFHYWPYGEARSHVGSSPTPLTFVGTLGYYMDSASRYYVRARVYRADLGRWTSVDPLWPRESAYGYAGGNPASGVDPSGMSGLLFPGPGARDRPLPFPPPPSLPGAPGPGATCGRWNEFVFEYCTDCHKAGPCAVGNAGCQIRCDQVAAWYHTSCKGDRTPYPGEAWYPAPPPGRPPGIYPYPANTPAAPPYQVPRRPGPPADSEGLFNNCVSLNPWFCNDYSHGAPGLIQKACLAFYATCMIDYTACKAANSIDGFTL